MRTVLHLMTVALMLGGCVSHRLPPPSSVGSKAVIPLTREQMAAALGDSVLEACPSGTGCVFSPVNGITVWIQEDGQARLLLDRSSLPVPLRSRAWLLQDGSGETVPIAWGDATNSQALPTWDEVSPPAEAAGEPVLGVTVVLNSAGLGVPVRRGANGTIEVADWWGWQPWGNSGLAPGDQIVSVAGAPVGNVDLNAALSALSAVTGDEAIVVVSRDGQQHTFTVRLTRRVLLCQKLWIEGGSDAYLPMPDPKGVQVLCPPNAIDFVPLGV